MPRSREPLPGVAHRCRPPALPAGSLPRTPIIDAVLAAPGASTILLSAPRGFGKTTVLAQALGDDPSVAWVTLDGVDRDARQLAADLATALDLSQADRRSLTAAGDDAVACGVALAEALERAPIAWIVLDGVASRAHGPALPLISYLCEHLPVATRVAITTDDSARAIGFDRLTARLTLVDHADLTLTPDEATRLVVSRAPDLAIDAVDALVALAGGWASACDAAARQATRRTDDPIAWLASTGVDRLVGPMLAGLPHEHRDLLIATSMLERLSGPLCDAVLQSSGSTEILQQLEDHQSLLFPSVLPDAERWWARHPLVTAALRRLASGMDESAVRRRAADWLRAHEYFDEAMQQLLASGSFAEAGQYLAEREQALFNAGAVDRVVTWYGTLPTDAWGEAGLHMLRSGWGKALSGDIAGAELSLSQLAAHLAGAGASTDGHHELEPERATLAALLALRSGDVETAVMESQRAVDLFDDRGTPNARQLAPIILIRALLARGDVLDARQQLTRIAHQPFPLDSLREAMLAGVEAQSLIDEGHVAAGRRIADRSMRWLSGQDAPRLVISSSTLIAHAAGLIEAGRPEEGMVDLEPVVEASVEAGFVTSALEGLLWQIRGAMAMRDYSAALDRIRRSRSILEPMPASPLVARVDEAESLLRYVVGDSVRAERLVQGLPRSERRTLLWARFTFVRQPSSAARSLLTVPVHLPRWAAEQQLVLAEAALRRSRRRAEDHIVRIADISAAEGSALVLVGASPELLDFAHNFASMTSHDALRELVIATRNGFDRSTSGALERPSEPVRGRLSRGELHLLTFLPTRKTNVQIAQELNVSVNTVKTRLARLYRKLGVSGRDEAVRVAHNLRLLDDVQQRRSSL